MSRCSKWGFANGAGFECGINRNAHVLDALSESKMRKMSMPWLRFANKFNDDVIGIGGVTDGVGAAEEHLETDVGNALAQLAQSLPGIFVQERMAVSKVAPPHVSKLKRCGRRCARVLAVRADRMCGRAGHERLVRVSESRVGNEQALFFSRQAANSLARVLQERRVRPGFAEALPDNCGFDSLGICFLLLRDCRLR